VPEAEPYGAFIAEIIRELKLEKSRVGIEGDFMPVAAYHRLVMELPKAVFGPSNIIHGLKLVKSPEAPKMVENGVSIVDKACELCYKVARPGKTWNEISSEVSQTLFHLGIEDIGKWAKLSTRLSHRRLRHSCTTRCLVNKAEFVHRRLGHKNIKTIGVYLDVTDADTP
jgi:Xaa-Pro aminopeptidase